MPRPQYHYGLIGPDPFDSRDLYVSLPPVRVNIANEAIDLSPLMTPIEMQETLGACSSFALNPAIMYADVVLGRAPETNSHLQLYYNARTSVNKKLDVGATLRDALKAASIYGAAPENLWPYDISKFAVSPPAAAIKAGFRHTALKYARVGTTPGAVYQALQNKLPVIAAIKVYESFESASVATNGLVPVPVESLERFIGGHAVLIVGYVETPLGYRFKCRNSWSTAWGDQGYFYLPIEFINSSLCWDFWTLSAMSGGPKAKLMAEGLASEYGLTESTLFENLPALYDLLKDFLNDDGSLSAEFRIPIQAKIAQFLEGLGL